MKSLTVWFGLIMLSGWLVLPVLAQDDPKPAPQSPQSAKMTCCSTQPQCGQTQSGPIPGRGCPLCTHCRHLLRCLFVLVAVINVLLAFWVYTDIRKRGEGHGIFIILALLAGIPATILYALVRIGDKRA